jgi:hypothetical protein
MTAICGSASVRIGRTVLRVAPPFQPPTGSQASVRPKTIWSSGDAHHRMIGAPVLPEGGEHPERAADQQRQRQRRGAEPHRDRQSLGEQLGDGEIAEIEGGAEIAAQQGGEIGQVLLMERPVELVDAAQIRHHRRFQRLLEIERPARR